jgi:phosphoribosylformylglycinamidine cyclo-ligase
MAKQFRGAIMSQAKNYAEAGVDIAAADAALKAAKSAIEQTHTPQVLTSIGGFASLFDLSMVKNDYQHPVLVQSIDGVGTKSQIAALTGCYDSIGQDLVSATCNDIIVMGAKPITMLDYVATDHIEPQYIETIITSVANACRDCGVALVGGETAEMPDIYHAKEHDIVGVITGLVEKDHIISGPAMIQQEDVIVGIASNGLHTNGFSLARHVLLKKAGLQLADHVEELNSTLAAELLRPHTNYTKPILKALDAGSPIHGMAHITGGGLMENLPRILPDNCDAVIDAQSWQPLPIFNLIQSLGKIEQQEMMTVFNMGIGYVCVLNANDADALMLLLKESGLSSVVIGHITAGHQSVRLD